MTCTFLEWLPRYRRISNLSTNVVLRYLSMYQASRYELESQVNEPPTLPVE